MSRTRVHPHLIASDSAVKWDDWSIEQDGDRRPAAPLLAAWDYDQALRVGTSPTIDLTALRTSTGLDDLSDVAVVVTVDCPGTSSRFVAGLPVVEYALGIDPFIAVDIEPGSVALELRLACHLVLLGDHERRGAEASASGSRLAESPSTRIILEGEASRFPTEAVSFTDLGLEPAAWSIRVEPDDMNEAFGGCVRLMLNLDNQIGSSLASMDPVAYSAYGPIVRMDIVRAVIHVCLEIEGDSGAAAFLYDEDSFGGVVERMCGEHFGMTLDGVRELRAHDVDRFERVLQSSVGLGVTA